MAQERVQTQGKALHQATDGVVLLRDESETFLLFHPPESPVFSEYPMNLIVDPHFISTRIIQSPPPLTGIDVNHLINTQFVMTELSFITGAEPTSVRFCDDCMCTLIAKFFQCLVLFPICFKVYVKCPADALSCFGKNTMTWHVPLAHHYFFLCFLAHATHWSRGDWSRFQ